MSKSPWTKDRAADPVTLEQCHERVRYFERRLTYLQRGESRALIELELRGWREQAKRLFDARNVSNKTG